MKKNVDILNKLKKEFDYDDYKSFLLNVEKAYGKLYVFIVLISDYLYVIDNYGHEIYFTDNYAGENEEPYISDEIDLTYYNMLMELIEQLNIEKELNCVGFYEQLSKFKIEIDDRDVIEETCEFCFGGEVYDEQEDESDICHKCGGIGLREVDNPDYGKIKNPEYLDKLDLIVKPKIEIFVDKLNNFI